MKRNGQLSPVLGNQALLGRLRINSKKKTKPWYISFFLSRKPHWVITVPVPAWKMSKINPTGTYLLIIFVKTVFTATTLSSKSRRHAKRSAKTPAKIAQLQEALAEAPQHWLSRVRAVFDKADIRSQTANVKIRAHFSDWHCFRLLPPPCGESRGVGSMSTVPGSRADSCTHHAGSPGGWGLGTMSNVLVPEQTPAPTIRGV